MCFTQHKEALLDEQELMINHLKQQLQATRAALEDVTNKYNSSNEQLKKIKRTVSATECESQKALQRVEELEEQLCLSKQSIAELQSELNELKEESSPIFTTVTSERNQIVEFCCITKSGRFYTPAIRMLYYKLLADLIPPEKIAQTIKYVLKCFLPRADLSQLQLPAKSCAGYMRSCELETLDTVHKATHISKVIQTDASTSTGLSLNSDGTTLHQKKLGATVIAGTLVSLNELPDGSAETIIDDMDSELKKLRDVAKLLKLPNADAINWTLLSSSTSDSASTQKTNKLIVEKQKQDQQLYGPVRSEEGKELVKNFCAMHLAVNLRSAFLNGMKLCDTNTDTAATGRERYPVDVIVHEFCKLFGKRGTPEYGAGVLLFPDFLSITAERVSDPTEKMYYKNCLSITLDRQVGSRYFVTAANAGKVLYLRRAAIQYLSETGKSKGNKLERELFTKLQDPSELVWLRADALMFLQVYGDLVTLAKSKELNKSVLDMNTHYSELNSFLEVLQENPKVIVQPDTKVFESEKRIYEENCSLNHRTHKRSAVVKQFLLTPNEEDEELLYPLVADGAQAMKEKLCHYASNQLPGGIYWNPTGDVKKILSELKPNNDICESILGLNDWISGQIPNLKQSTCSTLVKVKRNHTLSWLDQLSNDGLDEVVMLAVGNNKEQKEQIKADEEKIRVQRRAHLTAVMEKRAKAIEKQRQLQAELENVTVFRSASELHEALDRVTESGKKKTTLKIIREQIRARKVLFNENKIYFTRGGKQRPLNQIIKEFEEYLNQNQNPTTHLVITDPSFLVGKQVSHKFITDEERKEVWYTGEVIDYDSKEKVHVIKYDGEDQLCYFDLSVDIIEGDLVILS